MTVVGAIEHVLHCVLADPQAHDSAVIAADLTRVLVRGLLLVDVV